MATKAVKAAAGGSLGHRPSAMGEAVCLGDFGAMVQADQDGSTTTTERKEGGSLVCSSTASGCDHGGVRSGFRYAPHFGPTFLRTGQGSLAASTTLASLSAVHLQPGEEVVLPKPACSFRDQGTSHVDHHTLFQSATYQGIFFRAAIPDLRERGPSLRFARTLSSPSPLILVNGARVAGWHRKGSFPSSGAHQWSTQSGHSYLRDSLLSFSMQAKSAELCPFQWSARWATIEHAQPF